MEASVSTLLLYHTLPILKLFQAHASYGEYKREYAPSKVQNWEWAMRIVVNKKYCQTIWVWGRREITLFYEESVGDDKNNVWNKWAEEIDDETRHTSPIRISLTARLAAKDDVVAVSNKNDDIAVSTA